VIRKLFFAFLGLFLIFNTMLSVAAEPIIWQIVPAQSSLRFTATQNGAPVTGSFTTFTGDIVFDPTELSKSHVQINVDLNSVSASYDEVADNLKAADWFNVKIFPQAVFKADHFIKTGNNYEADGSLTIKGKTVPTKLKFILNDYSQDKAHATGAVTLKRNAFNIGQGDWANTDVIKDDVQVDFVISAVRKK
jgi:polyisoprenoid-binding protein YceI